MTTRSESTSDAFWLEPTMDGCHLTGRFPAGGYMESAVVSLKFGPALGRIKPCTAKVEIRVTFDAVPDEQWYILRDGRPLTEMVYPSRAAAVAAMEVVIDNAIRAATEPIYVTRAYESGSTAAVSTTVTTTAPNGTTHNTIYFIGRDAPDPTSEEDDRDE